MQNTLKITGTLAHGYSFESSESLSNEYQHDIVKIVFKNLNILLHWTKVDLALEGLKVYVRVYYTFEVWR